MIDSLDKILRIMIQYGAKRFYAKKLAPNDNSKNQVYLGGDFSALNIIPHGEIYSDNSSISGAKRSRPKASVEFYWINGLGKFRAPNAQLILYPDYPEVRMSGFLKGCSDAPSGLMNIRDEGRVLVFGITDSGEMLGYVASSSNPMSEEISVRAIGAIGVFLELPNSPTQNENPRATLIANLSRIYKEGWIQSQKLGKGGAKELYVASNGGGYTLEAELGVSPNGYAEPDFLGWEVKQYGVRDFKKFAPKSPVTLMTPEPTGGIYADDGPEAFVRRFGYLDKMGRADRMNFGGVYSCVKGLHDTTGLKLVLNGFDNVGLGKIRDINGSISLIDHNDVVAASWSFKNMMAHWNRKHAQAAYIPSIFNKPPPQYAFGPKILLCERTDFILYLKAVALGYVYYDPGIKLENVSSTSPKIKRRSQFRIKHSNLVSVYHEHEYIDLEHNLS